MNVIEEHYFRNANEWSAWLAQNHGTTSGIYLIFYSVAHENESMRWEEAVRVAICFGWIDSTVKNVGVGIRRQYFCPRNAKSVWSKVNKNHIMDLKAEGLMHESGLAKIAEAKKNGSWTALDAVEKGIVPEDLQLAFNAAPLAYANYKNFSRGQRKSYLYWLNQAKREPTRKKRITEIITNCLANQKSR